MDKLTLDLPAMYGDHHVLEVRKILLGLKGVEEVYASSAFRVVEIHFDEEQINAYEIIGKLDESGYLGGLPIPEERGEVVDAVGGNGEVSERRSSASLHSFAMEKRTQALGFTQKVLSVGRPLWPCPGMGAVKLEEEEAHA